MQSRFDGGVRESIWAERHRRFRELLIAERKRARLTQPQLAVRLGKPKSYVGKYEVGSRRLDALEFVDVCAAIGCDPVRLMRRVMREYPASHGKSAGARVDKGLEVEAEK